MCSRGLGNAKHAPPVDVVVLPQAHARLRQEALRIGAVEADWLRALLRHRQLVHHLQRVPARRDEIHAADRHCSFSHTESILLMR